MTTLYENDDVIVESAGSHHPGLDSGIDLARQSGNVMIGHVVWKHAGNGADCFDRTPLSIVAITLEGSVDVLYEYGWRWSESGQRNVLGWWYGSGEWDVASIQAYGPVWEVSVEQFTPGRDRQPALFSTKERDHD